jgi:hypothetical protein
MTKAMQAVETAKHAQSHAMDVHLKKNSSPSQNLLMTAGLNRACNGGGVPGSEKVQIVIEVCIKGSSKRDQQTTDPSFGKWA